MNVSFINTRAHGTAPVSSTVVNGTDTFPLQSVPGIGSDAAHEKVLVRTPSRICYSSPVLIALLTLVEGRKQGLNSWAVRKNSGVPCCHFSDSVYLRRTTTDWVNAHS